MCVRVGDLALPEWLAYWSVEHCAHEKQHSCCCLTCPDRHSTEQLENGTFKTNSQQCSSPCQVHSHTNAHIHTHTHTLTLMHTYTHTHTHTHSHLCTHTHTHTYRYRESTHSRDH